MRPTRFNETERPNDLGSWWRIFWQYPSPRIIAAAFALAAGTRLALGGWRRLDLVVVLVVVAAQPFTEWVLHVFVLHFRPRKMGAVKVDLYIAKKHRAHHLDPVDIGMTFVQLPALFPLIAGFFVALLVGFRNLPLALSGTVSGYVLLFVYEWMHFLIHSTYVPRSRIYKIIYRAHRLHHFKSEHYWFGVTNPIGDIVLRTYPNQSTVTLSSTARTLGVEV